MKPRKSLGILILAVAVTGLVVFLLVRQDKGEVVSGESPATAGPEQRKDDVGSRPEAEISGSHEQKRKKRKPKLPKNSIDKRKRAEMLALILSALQEKERRIEEKHSREPPKPTGLKPEYIREAVKEIIPLLKECYEIELEERGIVRGKVVLGFDLIADDEHGGLVEEVRIEETELSKDDSDSFTECLRESVYALRLDAAEWGGRTTVRYPLRFNAIGF